MSEISKKSCLKLIAGLAVFSVASCTTAPTPYQPAEGRHGYVSEDVADGLVRVGFRGNAQTSEAAVEAALFRRIVDIADARNARSFTVIESETECVTQLRTSPTTTCVYRQSADAMFPYHFGVHEIDSIWHASPQREYEATATIGLFDDETCDGTANCFVTREARATLGQTTD